MTTIFPLKKSAAIFLSAVCVFAPHIFAQTNTPSASSSAACEWIDPDTGHRIIQLSTEPGSDSFYFNLNPFTPDGKKMAFTSPTGISMIDLETRKIEQIVAGRHLHVIQVGRKTGRIYYSEGTNVFAADPETKTVRKIAALPPGAQAGSVNCDETLLAGTVILDADKIKPEPEIEKQPASNPDSARKNKGRNIDERFNQHLPMELFFLNLRTGEQKNFDRCTDWLNHLLFSPTDPNLLMFCHEGPWHKVDRIWTIRSDGSDLKSIHQRTMAMEIAGHEFWSADGKTIWFDLQTPRGEDFWVAGYNVETGARTQYHLQRDEWSVHFNVSPDGKLFSGDGGDSRMVAHAPDGKWLYLFHPELLPDESGTNIDSKNLIKPGVFHSEKLVNMSKHDYSLEPNARFSPDMKWLIFRSNMSGADQVYAVEIQTANLR